MKIDSYISELLYDHDCVIVMDLGGIIAHYHPASINKALNVINPPSKRLAFNASLRNNDGLLAHHISSKEALNYADACQVIREYVENAKNQMADGKKLKIEKVGVLFFDKDRNLQFQPDQNANYLIDSFGLSPVHAPVIKREVPIEEVAESFGDKNAHIFQSKPSREIRIFKWKVLEIVPAAAVLTFLLMVPPVLDRLNTNMSTLLPFSRINEYVNELKGVEPINKPFKIEYTSPFNIPPASGIKNEKVIDTSQAVQEENSSVPVENTTPITVTNPVKETEIAAAENTSTETVTPPAVVNSSVKYHIIGGSFRSYHNAEKLVADLNSRKIDAEIIGQNRGGLYLVSLLSSDNFTQINDALPALKESAIPTAWVYTK